MNFQFSEKVGATLESSVPGFGAWEFDLQTKTLSFDRAAASLLGIESLEKRSSLDAMTEIFGEEQLRLLYAHLQSVSTADSLFRLKSNLSGKSPRFFSFRGGLKGEKVVGLFCDNTLENQKVSLALEASGFGVWKFNPLTSKLTWDDKMYSIYGHTHETFDQKPDTWTATLHIDDRQVVANRFADLLAGMPVEIFEFRIIRHSDKSVRFIEGNGSSLIDSTGKVVLVVGMNRDITERKLELERQDQQRVMLASTSKMAELGAMAAGIAHEINNPLAILIGKTELLKRKLEANVLDFTTLNTELDLLFAVSNRIAEIVRSLRTYSRNSEKDPQSNVRVSEIIRDTLRLCVDRFKTGKIDVQVDNSLLERIRVLCRPTQISQVFLNLLNNSADALESSSIRKISIRAEQNKNWLKIYFEDTGMGIPPEIAAKIFDPFYTTKQPGKGTGLGLSISKNIIEAHGGQLTIGKSGGGACFIVELPIAEVDFQTRRAKSDANSKSETERTFDIAKNSFLDMKFLVVDDEKDIQKILQEELQERGAKVVCASSATEAMAKLKKEKFDVLITDFAMPGGDGLSLIRKINLEMVNARPAIFLCTAFNVCSDETAKELNIAQILSKPFRIASLCRRISDSLSLTSTAAAR